MSIFNALNTAVMTTLAAGTALTGTLGGTAIYYGQAPDNTALPYVVFSYQAASDENQTRNRMKNIMLYVRGYSSSDSQAGTIDSQVDALIHGKTLTVTGWTNNFWTAREDDISLVENAPDGSMIYSVGGIYRLRLS